MKRIVNGIEFMFDDDRGVWVSVSRNTHIFSKALEYTDEFANLFLSASGFVKTHDYSGAPMMRDAIVTAVSTKSDNGNRWNAEIIKNNDRENPMAVVGSLDGSTMQDNLALPLKAMDVLNVRVSTEDVPGTARPKNPIVMVETAWVLED